MYYLCIIFFFLLILAVGSKESDAIKQVCTVFYSSLEIVSKMRKKKTTLEVMFIVYTPTSQ